MQPTSNTRPMGHCSNLNILNSMLTNYRVQNTAHELLNDFEYGFNVHYSGTREFHV